MKRAIVGAFALLCVALGGCASAPDLRDELTAAAKVLSQNCPDGAESQRCVELEDAVSAAVKAVRDAISVPSDEATARAAFAVARAVQAAKAFEAPDAGK